MLGALFKHCKESPEDKLFQTLQADPEILMKLLKEDLEAGAFEFDTVKGDKHNHSVTGVLRTETGMNLRIKTIATRIEDQGWEMGDSDGYIRSGFISITSLDDEKSMDVRAGDLRCHLFSQDCFRVANEQREEKGDKVA